VGRDTIKAAFSQFAEVILLGLVLVLCLLLLLSSFFLGLNLLLGEGLLTLAVEGSHRAEVVVGASVALDVDAHALEHFEFVAVVVDFKDLGLVLLEEPIHGVVSLGSIFKEVLLIMVGLSEQA